MIELILTDDTNALETLFKTTSDDVIIDAIGNIDRFITDHFSDHFVYKERMVDLMLMHLANDEDNLLALGLLGNGDLSRRLKNKVRV